MLADRVRMGSGGKTGIFPPFLYKDGEEGVEWVEGYSSSPNNVVQKRDTSIYLSIFASRQEVSIVTKTKVDLTPYSILRFGWSPSDFRNPNISSLTGSYYVKFVIVRNAEDNANNFAIEISNEQMTPYGSDTVFTSALSLGSITGSSLFSAEVIK